MDGHTKSNALGFPYGTGHDKIVTAHIRRARGMRSKDGNKRIEGCILPTAGRTMSLAQ